MVQPFSIQNVASINGSHTQFLRYHFTSWPFVPESNGFSLELEEPADIAYDTVGGTMFVPYDCPGTNPEICKTGPIYGK